MKHVYSLILVLFLVVAPLLSIGTSLAHNTEALVLEERTNIQDTGVPDNIPGDDINLSMMFFTETPSSDNGLYYVCRRGTDPLAYFGASSVMYLSEGHMVSLEFPGSRFVMPVGERPTGSVTNYLLGNDRSTWKTNIADYSVLRYSEIYPGIDLVYGIHDGNLKYEFVVKPYADSSIIRMSYPDALELRINADSLIVSMVDFSLSDTGLRTIQDDDMHEVASSFRLVDACTIGFDIGSYDRSQALFIDPILVYSTFIGGKGSDRPRGIAIEDGFIYLTGFTLSSDFPTANAYDSSFNSLGYYDGFVVKFSADGQTLVYSTFIGGSLGDYSQGIAVENGYAYISGVTQSSNFPTLNGFNLTSNGGDDTFVVKLSTDGQSLNYSTYLGGSDHEYSSYIAVEDGFAYVAGRTQSTNFPTTANALNETSNGGQECFVTKINTAGNGIIYSTYLGGSDWDEAYGIAVENGYAYVTGMTTSSNFPTVNGYASTHSSGYDAFVALLALDGQSLVSSTFFGGSNNDYGQAIASDGDAIYITGFTGSDDLPMTNSFDSTRNGNWDVFVAKFGMDLQDLLYSTFLGGSDMDRAYAIAVENGSAYITGHTYSTNYPTRNAYSSTLAGMYDCVVTKLSVDGLSIEYSTYLGGPSADEGFAIAVKDFSAYIAGATNSPIFPTVDAYNVTQGGDYDCFVSILSEDRDNDGLSDWHEALYGTNPQSIDSDHDGAIDSYEITEGTDPLDPFSYPGATSNSEYNIAYSSYIGGSSTDNLEFIRVVEGFIYLAGKTASPDFPLVNAWNATYSLTYDAFIVKMTEDGQSIIYSTYIGGIYEEALEGMDVYDGCVFIAGYTSSPNFPTYLAYDSELNGSIDGFLFKLAANGSRPEFSTYLGGGSLDYIRDLCVEDGHAYVVGDTQSINFPTVNAYDSSTPTTADVFLTKFSIDGQSLVFSTYLGGDTHADYAMAIAVDNGFTYVGGYTLSSDFPLKSPLDDTLNNLDGYLTKFSQDGRTLIYSTFIGGSSSDVVQGISVERGYAYLTGYTLSSDFPLVNPLFSTKLGSSQSGFVARMDTEGSSFIYSTYLTGSSTVIPNDIIADRGYVYVTGQTDSTDYPIVGGYATPCGSSSMDAFISELAVDGQSLLYSSCFGGSSSDYSRSIDTYNGRVYIAGYTNSDDHPVLIGYNEMPGIGTDGFVTCLDIDTDFDALPDFTEWVLGTNPHAIDTDGDNFIDGYEFSYGSNPLDISDYPTIPQAWYDAIYEDLDGNSTLIQNLIAWSNGNSSLLETVKQQLEDNATLLQQVIAWLDGNHSAIETLFTQLNGNATLLMTTVSHLNGNASLIENLLSWSDGNSTLLLSVIGQLADNSDLLTTVIGWLDGNHTAIETLFTYLDGNATLLLSTVNALSGNSSLIQNLLTWSAGNETLLLNVIAQVDALEATDLSQVIAWLDGNHSAIETLFTYMEGNATLLLNVVNSVNANAVELDVISALILGNIAALNALNATHIQDFNALRAIIDELGISIGDTDYDGLDDLDELHYGTDPLCIDSDTDNLNDAFEILLGTDPLSSDSDLDSYLDGVEVIAGSDPLDPLSYPGSTQGIDPAVMVLAIGGIGGVAIVLILIVFKKVRKS